MKAILLKRITFKSSYLFQNIKKGGACPPFPTEDKFEEKRVCLLFYGENYRISEILSLSSDCLPSRIKASVCGVSASQLFGRGVANSFNPLSLAKTVKNTRGLLGLDLKSWQ
jgi:hypothetical protein